MFDRERSDKPQRQKLEKRMLSISKKQLKQKLLPRIWT